jgi:hypothetical protein
MSVGAEAEAEMPPFFAAHFLLASSSFNTDIRVLFNATGRSHIEDQWLRGRVMPSSHHSAGALAALVYAIMVAAVLFLIVYKHRLRRTSCTVAGTALDTPCKIKHKPLKVNNPNGPHSVEDFSVAPERTDLVR